VVSTKTKRGFQNHLKNPFKKRFPSLTQFRPQRPSSACCLFPRWAYCSLPRPVPATGPARSLLPFLFLGLACEAARSRPSLSVALCPWQPGPACRRCNQSLAGCASRAARRNHHPRPPPLASWECPPRVLGSLKGNADPSPPSPVVPRSSSTRERPQPQCCDPSELPVRPSASPVVPEPPPPAFFCLGELVISPLSPRVFIFAKHGR
jgi:hypothetical protein